MTRVLSCYYLDEALSPAERDLVAQTLLGPWARFKTGAQELSEWRVPNVLPLFDGQDNSALAQEAQAEKLVRNLRHAGISRDKGIQVLWVAPAEMRWDALFHFAIMKETGMAPFVLQRWFVQGDRGDRGDQVERGQAKIFDTHMLRFGK